jgi:four helix bundle protein
MERTNFENLQIYKLSESLSDRVWNILSNWDSFSRDTVGKQLVRAADSIGANIAEGCGRYGILDNRRFAYIARGSLYETKHWLRRAFQRNLLNQNDVDDLKLIIDELAPKLNAYINSLNRMKNNSTNNDPRSTNKTK